MGQVEAGRGLPLTNLEYNNGGHDTGGQRGARVGSGWKVGLGQAGEGKEEGG